MATITHQIGLRIDSGLSARGLDFVRDIDDSALSVASSRFTDHASGSVSLPADGTPVKLSLGALVDARGLYLEVLGGTTKVWLNVADVDIDTPGAMLLRPAAQGASAHLYLDVGLTDIYLASQDAVAVSGLYAVWGFSRPQD